MVKEVLKSAIELDLLIAEPEVPVYLGIQALISRRTFGIDEGQIVNGPILCERSSEVEWRKRAARRVSEACRNRVIVADAIDASQI